LLYINDLPHASQLETTLFADDTYLTLSDKSITNLECKVNNELIKIEEWLKQNRLSLNCSKSCYMLINSHPSISCNFDLQLSLNNFTLKRHQTIKYLGICIDENLKLSSHIHHLSLQNARYTGLFHCLRCHLPLDVLLMLYYSLVYSRIHYDIVIMGECRQNVSTRTLNLLKQYNTNNNFQQQSLSYDELV